jgi:hypothetical protein
MIDRRRVPVRAMTPELPQEQKIHLAFAIAEGKSAATWARETHIPRSTAYRWAADPQVRRVAQSCRRRSFHYALSQMTARATWACDETAKLARVAESESMRLRALRAIVCDLVAISKIANRERRVARVQEGVSDRLNEVDVPSPRAETTRPTQTKRVR